MNSLIGLSVETVALNWKVQIGIIKVPPHPLSLRQSCSLQFTVAWNCTDPPASVSRLVELQVPLSLEIKDRAKENQY